MTKTIKVARKPATMLDVARLAGVSQPTVSRVLNQTDTSISISEETRTKVRAAVAELDYRPNMLARGLRTQQTQMIAVMIADICNSFYHPIVRAIQDVAAGYGYDIMIANSDHLYEHELHFCEAIYRRPMDGVIMVPIHLTHDDLSDFMERTNAPLALLHNHFDHPQVDMVYADDENATFEATRWLIRERGHREIGFIGVPDDLPPGPRRRNGFLRALGEDGLHLKPQHHIISDFSLEGGRWAARQLLQGGDLPSAVLVLNDLMAIGAMLTLQEAGYRVPQDIAIVGYDDIPEAKIVRPALTTIIQDSVDMGHKLATCLFERIENPALPQRRLRSQNRLIVRDSA